MSETTAPKERFSAYHVVLLGLLGIATLYEGFDASMLTLASVDVRATLHIGLDEWGTLYAITRAGMIASFFFLMCADRFGRRTLLLITVGGFAIASGATAFVQTKVEFTVCADHRAAVPDGAVRSRGHHRERRTAGAVCAEPASRYSPGFATVGTVAMAKTSPFFLLIATRRESGARLRDALRRGRRRAGLASRTTARIGAGCI